MFGSKTAFKPEIQKPGTLTWPFKLGDEVKDKINGLTGIAVARFYHISGCDTFLIELPPKDGKTETFHVNGERLELVTAHPERHIDESWPADRPQLGDKARGAFSKVEGNVCLLQVPLFGAPQVDVSPVYDAKQNKLPDGYFIDAHNVEVIEPYDKPEPVNKPTAPEVPPKTEAAPKPTRGSSPMPRGGYRPG